MPRYQYTAIAAGGKKIKGTITAESPYAARKQLRVRSVHPSSVTEISSAAESQHALLRSFRKVSKSQIVDFTKQLATLLNSGIKLTEALSVLTLQTSDHRFKTALTEIRDRVVTGESFTDALNEYRDYFDVIYVAMVRVGEVTGTLGGSLRTIANFMEKRQRVEAKVVTAMIYPIVLICFCVLAVLILTTKVIPKIGAQIERAGQELPWITAQLMNFSHVIMSWWILVILAGLAAVVLILRKIFRTERGAYLRDKFILSLPFFGPLIKQRVVARFASTLSTLIGSGLAMAESLRVVAETTGNSLMKRAIQHARERILAGADIATPLRDSGVIDPAIAHMVAVGEKSGELETMLKSISENLESSTDVVIERLSAAVEPVIIIVMAGVVGVIAYATILPILRISVANF
ncbi:MAG: type II secretion system F family protein [Sedimentisphaerales bacterium]|jgi:type II secretory pathway component PulF|nr:type II secretion system F family protein [Sedimentisphaerales bacterium]NLZ06316.1 type II secretion system F family protein [Phycisphaerae bacterium]HNY79078.1 type II secretion system F family protein [Sedimentisphaerales bacterium]HOC64430.1 type II secretion system F family protein [Sedimentisphaerales bacterium]HOH65134.1 type II secretion system F family protein [Sedimentisphaerales bacterium]